MIKSHCVHGHEIAVVGRFAGGNCKGCNAVRGKLRYNKSKTHCRHGHEIAVVGTFANGACKACQNAHILRWRTRNPEKHAAHRLKAVRKRLGVLNAHGEIKSGACAICSEHKEKLNLDHDHTTGAIRGWLCTKCNTGLGVIENRQWLAKAEEYLKRSC